MAAVPSPRGAESAKESSYVRGGNSFSLQARNFKTMMEMPESKKSSPKMARDSEFETLRETIMKRDDSRRNILDVAQPPALRKGYSSDDDDDAYDEVYGIRSLQISKSLRGQLYRALEHRCFTFVVLSAIGLHALFMGVELELTLNSNPTQATEKLLFGIATTFELLFLFELLLRMAVYQLRFFRYGWHVFDFFIVSLSCVDNIMMLINTEQDSSLSIVLALRLLRIARLARMVKILRYFRELWMLIMGIFDAMKTLFWAWCLIILVIYVWAIFSTRMIGKPHVDDSEDIAFWFGSVPLSMFTLFMVVTLEGWPDVCRECMRYEGWSWIIFLTFIFITSFAIMNVVIAVVVESTLDKALNDDSAENQKKEKDKKAAIMKIYEVFRAADADGNGMLTREEFLNALKDNVVNQNLHEVGIDVRRAENLFDVLDLDESGLLDVREFVEGVLRARGPALSKDLLCIHCDLLRSKNSLYQGCYEFRNDLRRMTQATFSEAEGALSDVQTLKALCASKQLFPEIS